MSGGFCRGSLKIETNSCTQLYPQKLCTTLFDNWLTRAVETGGVKCAVEIGFCGLNSMRAGRISARNPRRVRPTGMPGRHVYSSAAT